MLSPRYETVLHTNGSIGRSRSPTRLGARTGAVVANVPLGTSFPRGPLATHDGDDEPDDATNFKFTRWDDVALPLGLVVDTLLGDPSS